MAAEREICVLLFALITICDVRAQLEATVASCIQGTTATEVIATLRVKLNGMEVTELTAFSLDGTATYAGETSCTTGVTSGGFMELVLTFDTGMSACGVEQNTMTATLYDIRVHAIGPDIIQPYLFYCDTANLPSTAVVSGALTISGKLPVYGLYERFHRVRLQAVDTDSNIPITAPALGQNIHYRLILDKGSFTTENTNWGRKFHISFLKTDPAAKLSVDIYTPAHGTTVRVSGILAGSEFQHMFGVTKERPKINYKIDSMYQPTSDTGTWNTEDKGIVIEGFHDDIGVRVNVDNGYEQTDSYIAYPDSALEAGLFRLPTMPTTGTSAQAVIIATQDSTMLTLSNYDVAVTVPGGITSVTLNQQQTYHMFCATTCTGISVSADKPVAVISGNGQDLISPGTVSGHVVSPVLPTTKFGRRFVIPSVVPDTIATEVHYKLLYDTPEFMTQMNWLHVSGPTLKHDGDGPLTFPSVAEAKFGMEEFEIDPTTNGGSPPTASVTQYYTGTGAIEPSMISIPPVEHWAPVHVVPTKVGVTYRWIVVSTKDDIQNIRITTTGVDRLLGDLPVASSDVSPHSGASVKYGFIPLISTALQEWYRFEALDKSKPFMLLTYEFLSDNRLQAFTSFGQRTAAIHPAGGCVYVSSQSANVPVFPGVRLGDGLDNDCDGRIDEETLNGQDDDGDGAVDEDLAAIPTMAGDFVAIYNTGLKIAHDAAFSTSVDVINNDGCNVESGNDPAKYVIPSVGHFQASLTDNTNYPDYWTIKTSDFMAFRFSRQPELWVQATVAISETEADLGADSCNAKRKRRDVRATSKHKTVYLQLNIVDKTNSTDFSEDNCESCDDSFVSWSLVVGLLMAIVIEVVLVIVFRREKKRCEGR